MALTPEIALPAVLLGFNVFAWLLFVIDLMRRPLPPSPLTNRGE